METWFPKIFLNKFLFFVKLMGKFCRTIYQIQQTKYDLISDLVRFEAWQKISIYNQINKDLRNILSFISIVKNGPGFRVQGSYQASREQPIILTITFFLTWAILEAHDSLIKERVKNMKFSSFFFAPNGLKINFDFELDSTP